MVFVDSHCHLDQLNYHDLHKDLADVLNKAKTCNVGLILSVSVSLENFFKMIKFIGYRDDVLFSCGVHPLYLEVDLNYNVFDLFRFSSWENVIALGETGLDYYHSKNKKQQQREMFQNHLDVAYRQSKPIIIHSRSARDDTISILREMKFPYGGILHCFTEDKYMAKVLLDLNFYISFSGILTFENSGSLRSVANYIPLNRILLESDAPFLAPVPYRGTENQPAYIYNVAKCLSEIKGVSVNKIASVTTLNFFNLFKLNQIEKYHHLINDNIIIN